MAFEGSALPYANRSSDVRLGGGPGRTNAMTKADTFYYCDHVAVFSRGDFLRLRRANPNGAVNYDQYSGAASGHHDNNDYENH